jgi:para-aminobenzoate synthetase/4-amino-4-deoxychorismate lyase
VTKLNATDPADTVNAYFVLLDDCHATVQKPTSRLYTGYVKTHVCTDPGNLDRRWPLVQAQLASGLHAVVLADYEWGAKLQGAGDAGLDPQDTSALRILLFKSLQFLSQDQVSQWLAQQDAGGCGAAVTSTASAAGVMNLQPSVSRSEFDEAVAHIHTLIAAGESYQVNYTYRLLGQQYGSPLALYRRLRERQAVPFGALIALPPQDSANEVRWVLSCSPELFLCHDAGQLMARPMKGTAPRHTSPELDQQSARWLATDPKNRAENVMIVDLLRNDLGRICAVGSVQVPTLFAIEHYPTAHQMTSTVTAQLATGVGFVQILKALYPCGSITGAPKINTMKQIARLESTPRGLYTGAIGWLDAPAAAMACGNFCLSVAIRTLTLGHEHSGLRAATLGIGGGVVQDSVATSEYDETCLKARFLTTLDPGFTLFETLRYQAGRLVHLDRHLARLAASALALGFAFNEQELRFQLAHHLAQLDAPGAYRLRMDLAHDGSLKLTHSLLPALPEGAIKLVLSNKPVPASERALLTHKTSLRTGYDQAIVHATDQGAFDTIFLNDAGEVTEGARSNIFVKIDRTWWTPPLSCGLLPGVMRGRLLESRSCMSQRVLHLHDLQQAQALAICSSLRGIVRAELSTEPDCGAA